MGKTTAIIRLAEALGDFHPAGFYTAEIREGGVRQGFGLVSFDGKRSILSHVGTDSLYRVGRYGVDMRGFEAFLDALDLHGRRTEPVIIDEIGKMECFSEKFINLVSVLLDSKRPVIATIALKGGGFIAGVKKREDVRLFELTQANRDLLVDEIVRYVRPLLSSR